jgi:predicted nucleotidyltransferase component of viral defense system
MIKLHEDKQLFGDSLTFTEAASMFSARLVEKDYYCTVLLDYFAGKVPGLVFKGGTCLAKVHADFFRLSEDLDFVIPVSLTASRGERQKLAAPVKEVFGSLPRELPCFSFKTHLTGANKSTQYVGEVSYRSLAAGQEELIKIDVGLREPLLIPPVALEARTILLNPSNERVFLAPVSLPCISLVEAFAEKFRAALSRREPAIRDFYDLDYGVRRLGLRPEDPSLARLVRRKMAVPGNGPADVSAGRLAALRDQVESRLKPVLRTKDFDAFDLNRVFKIVAAMAAKIG